MRFIADLHIHSRFSRATARNLDLEHLYIAAQLKGISVLATGDFTHPGWFAELSQKLVPAEPGLFRLADELAGNCNRQVPDTCRNEVRFVLSTEISNIYKKEGRTRKNHNLVFLPDFDSARRLIDALENIGNLRSDGRPILGLDARNLLEIALEVSDHGFLVPAHIWTPWFSILGSKSGFDSIEQCFEDLSEHIFALETGLSSDPPMNWRVSQLDGRTLISNSDAHSPQKLGREANLFDTELSYYAIRSALKTGNPKQFLGTIEFYPEEGKYHLDGHRKCGLRIHPRETGKHGGICPVCNRPLTLGVLHRVEQLADRSEDQRPARNHPYVHLIPLVEVLADLFAVGPGSKKVLTVYDQLLKKFGSEDLILRRIDSEILDRRSGIPLLAEAIRRVRERRINVQPGYDGEFGRICIFDPGERRLLDGQHALFVQRLKDPVKKSATETGRVPGKNRPAVPGEPAMQPEEVRSGNTAGKNEGDSLLDPLNARQRRAVTHTGGPLLLVAGPGTGKTLTLTHRVAYLIARRKVEPLRILAVTFTQKAAQEMRERIRLLLGDSSTLPAVSTFHAFCLQLVKESRGGEPFRVIDENERLQWIRRAAFLNDGETKKSALDIAAMADRIAAAKQQLLTADELAAYADPQYSSIAQVFERYQHLLGIQNLFDYEDLICSGVSLLESENPAHRLYRRSFSHVLVDEYQDLNLGQYRLLKALAVSGAEFFVIGDPDQAIYGFRGSDVRFFNRFLQDFPGAQTIHLETNYRSCQSILDASRQMIAAGAGRSDDRRIYSGIMGVSTIGIIETPTEKAEAVAVGKSIEQLLGGIGFFSIDFGKVDGRSEEKAFGFSDMAVLFRTARQGELLAEALAAAGIPCQLTTARNQARQPGLQAALAVVRLLENVGSYLDLESAAPHLVDQLKTREIHCLTQWGLDHECPTHQVLETARRLPLRGLETAGQRKILHLTNKLETLRHELRDLPLPEKLKTLAEKLNLPEFDIPDSWPHELPAHLRSEDGAGRADILSRISVQSDTDRYNQQAEKVALLTMHAAKGLEFPVVFVTGCEDDLIPFYRKEKEEYRIDEERRLFYVAMTRAKELLFLTYCRKRKIFGRPQSRRPSPFLVDIENNLKSLKKSSFYRRPATLPQQLRLF